MLFEVRLLLALLHKSTKETRYSCPTICCCGYGILFQLKEYTLGRFNRFGEGLEYYIRHCLLLKRDSVNFACVAMFLDASLQY